MLLTGLLNARHLLYSAALAPWLRDVPRPRRAVMAHLLTDEAFALTIAHFRRLGLGRHPRLLDRGDRASTFIPWNLATLAGVLLGGQIPDPARFGIDIIFPAAMIGLAVGLITGRRELVAALAGAAIGVVVALATSASIGIVAGGVVGPLLGLLVPAGRRRRRRRSAPSRPPSATRCPARIRPPRSPDPMSTNLVWLAILMFAVTYPSRALGLLAPAMDRLPKVALDYLQLVGPAVLAALAAVAVMVTTEEGGATSFHVGVEWLALFLCLGLVAWRKNLLLGLAARGRSSWSSARNLGLRLSRTAVSPGAPRPRSRPAGSDGPAPTPRRASPPAGWRRRPRRGWP